jgi:hypothetical protein
MWVARHVLLQCAYPVLLMCLATLEQGSSPAWCHPGCQAGPKHPTDTFQSECSLHCVAREEVLKDFSQPGTAAEGCRVIAFDLPPCGLSQRPLTWKREQNDEEAANPYTFEVPIFSLCVKGPQQHPADSLDPLSHRIQQGIHYPVSNTSACQRNSWIQSWVSPSHLPLRAGLWAMQIKALCLFLLNCVIQQSDQ